MIVLGSSYLLFWPVPIEPEAWDAPENQGYTGHFSVNEKLSDVRRIGLNGNTGPEDAAFGPDGLLYIATHEGEILHYDPASDTVSAFAQTGGRPLGIEFGPDGTLYVADAYLGLLRVSDRGDVELLTDSTDSGSSIRYANDLDIAANGVIYFTDASTRFGARQNGGTLPASMLDLMEHKPNGRLLKYDPSMGKTTVLFEGFSFANGLALTQDEKHLIVAETGSYEIHKISLVGDQSPETIVANLPGFPDNINRTADGTFWVGLVSPRSPLVDFLSDKPFLRKLVQRLPASIRPAAQKYGFVLNIDDQGTVLETLQGPSGDYSLTTGLVQSGNGDRYITSLVEPDIAVLEK